MAVKGIADDILAVKEVMPPHLLYSVSLENCVTVQY